MGELMGRKVSKHERLYLEARKAAIDTAGGIRAFRIIGSTYATALIKAEAMGIAYRQDEIVTDATVREFICYAYERATDDHED
jgi:hypothetical protein